MAHSHDGVGGPRGLLAGVHRTLVVLSQHGRLCVPAAVGIVVSTAAAHCRTVDVGARGRGEGGRVDGQAAVLLLLITGQLQPIRVASHARLELGGLALVRHLHVLAVALAGILEG